MHPPRLDWVCRGGINSTTQVALIWPDIPNSPLGLEVSITVCLCLNAQMLQLRKGPASNTL